MTKFPLPETSARYGDQPVEFIEEVKELYFRSILLKETGAVVPQHTHDHDHATLVGSGMARVWVDGEWIGDFRAGQAVGIDAGKQHVFQAIMSNTRLVCVHSVDSATKIKGG